MTPSPTTSCSTWGNWARKVWAAGTGGWDLMCSSTAMMRWTSRRLSGWHPRRSSSRRGPGRPDAAGGGLEVIRRLGPRIPILGVCLGHQCIGAAYGGVVRRGAVPVHGKVSRIFHDGRTIFEGVPSPFEATRYHSLIVERDSLPPVLEASAQLEDGTVMGLRHREYFVEGVQFHPEAILTLHGKQILRNILRQAGVGGEGPGGPRSVPGGGADRPP